MKLRIIDVFKNEIPTGYDIYLAKSLNTLHIDHKIHEFQFSVRFIMQCFNFIKKSICM